MNVIVKVEAERCLAIIVGNRESSIVVWAVWGRGKILIASPTLCDWIINMIRRFYFGLPALIWLDQLPGPS